MSRMQWLVIGLGVVFWLGVLINLFVKPPAAEVSAPVTAQTPATEDTIPKTAYLYGGSQNAAIDGGDKNVIIFESKETYDAFVSASASLDKYGIQELLLAGSFIYIENYTGILPLFETTHWGSLSKVRVLSGEHTGEIWWALTRHIHQPH